jgi:dTDP-4-amino-4,6-dideoxygalactose transaminase
MAERGVRVEQPVRDLRAASYWNDGLEGTADAYERVVSLPLYHDLSVHEQDYVAERLGEVVR